jgi:hypothetical protein
MRTWTGFAPAATCLLALWLAAAPAFAGDQLCERDLQPGAGFTRSALIDLIHPDFAAGHLDVVADKLYRAYDDSLTDAERLQPNAQIFLLRLKTASRSAPQQWTLQRLQAPEGAEALFSSDASGQRVVFDCVALGDSRPATYLQNMVSIALLMQKVLLPGWNAEDKKRFELISTRLKNHEDLLNNGLPMWPWELWLNGKRLDESDVSPLPGSQIIFMRPSAALEINTRSREKADLEGSLLVEPIGMIWYRKPDFSDWIGLSAVITSSMRQGMGYGVLLRYGRYTAGLTRHKSETGGEDTYLTLSFDLYDLIEKKREAYTADRDRLRSSFLNKLP